MRVVYVLLVYTSVTTLRDTCYCWKSLQIRVCNTRIDTPRLGVDSRWRHPQWEKSVGFVWYTYWFPQAPGRKTHSSASLVACRRELCSSCSRVVLCSGAWGSAGISAVCKKPSSEASVFDWGPYMESDFNGVLILKSMPKQPNSPEKCNIVLAMVLFYFNHYFFLTTSSDPPKPTIIMSVGVI